MGHRELRRVETLRAITTEASRLFADQGYSRTTTQQISERAGIAAGTLFRYFSTKNEILLMVFNQKYEVILDEEREKINSTHDAVSTVRHMMQAFLDISATQLENTLIYQRELLFGNSGKLEKSGKYRDESLAIMEETEQIISHKILASAAQKDAHLTEAESLAASRAIFASFPKRSHTNQLWASPIDVHG